MRYEPGAPLCEKRRTAALSSQLAHCSEHYYISIQNPTEKSDGAWISLFKLTKNHKDTFFFCKCGHKRRLSDDYSHNRRLSDGALVSVS